MKDLLLFCLSCRLNVKDLLLTFSYSMGIKMCGKLLTLKTDRK